MRKTIEETYCDICGKKRPVTEINYPVIFHTEQTEGHIVESYVSQQKLEVCDECNKKILVLHGEGAMGCNKYNIEYPADESVKVRRIRLLDEHEYKCYKHNIPHLCSRWWLRTPGEDEKNVKAVTENEEIVEVPTQCVIGVRPVIEIEGAKLSDGKRINDFLGTNWTIIYAPDDEPALALCDEITSALRFDEKNSYYDWSSIKRNLEEWLANRD